MKKKFATTFLCILCMLLCIICLVACTPNNNSSTGNSQSSNSDSTPGNSQSSNSDSTPGNSRPTSIAISAIYLNKSNLSLYTNESETLTITILPTNATETLTWISTAPSIATVNNGIITGVSEGSATIIASAPNGVNASCQVTITENDYGFVFQEYGSGYAVVAYRGDKNIVEVPSQYKNKAVVAIGNISDSDVTGLNPLTEQERLVRAGFYKNFIVEKIILPDSIVDINAFAFSGCSNLKDVVLNEGLQRIGYGAFYSNDVKKLVIPSTLNKIGTGLLNSKIESLEFKKIIHSHITNYFSYYESSASLNVPEYSYWNGKVDDHLEITKSEGKVVDKSSAGVLLELYYPTEYKLVNRWFPVYKGINLVLYGDYKIYTNRSKVYSNFYDGNLNKEFMIYYDCPAGISGKFYCIPETLTQIKIYETDYNENFVEDLNIEIQLS